MSQTYDALTHVYIHTGNVNAALSMSIYGIYLHAAFLSLTLGLPLAISAWLIQWKRTKDAVFLKYAKTATTVLAINFSLGVVTGTLVEFGLLDIWPTSMVLFAAPGFLPLAYEATVAFIGEATLLILFLATLGKWGTYRSIAIMLINWFLGSLSGYFILTVNAWMNVPWGIGATAQAFYPFMPNYGSQAINLTGTLNLAALLIHYTINSSSGALAVSSTNFTVIVGRFFDNPWLPFLNPDAIITTIHTLLAAYAVSLGAVAMALAYRYVRTKNNDYIKLLRPILWMLVVVLLVQPTIAGHFMGDTVVNYQPTKFTALVSLTGGNGVYGNEFYDPIEALFAYGNPSHPIYGFQHYMDQCDSLGNESFGELYKSLDPAMLNYVKPIANITLLQNCREAVESVESIAPMISGFYYMMIGAGIVAGLAAILTLFSFLWRVPILSRISDAINNALAKLVGGENVLPLLVFIMAIAAGLASIGGWAAREIGRQPWTIYGLITTNEVVTPIRITPLFEAIVYVIFTAIAVGGAVAMYYAATRPELLDRIRGLIGDEL